MQRNVFTKILVPVDGSKFSQDAAEYAVGIAKLTHAKVIALHVVHLATYVFSYSAGEGMSPMAIPTPLPVTLTEDERKEARKIVDDVKKVGEKAGVKVDTKVIERQPSVPDAIIQFAEENGVDLIIMGTKGKTAIRRFLLGSVTESVVHHAHCPVLVVR
ncbi:MAG TPA: universal stress protein [Candidatus Krumholzibacteriaceae bacterium]|nr:universal stress protein [Candidatus Krumholzibacteriaceae bacterium]